MPNNQYTSRRRFLRGIGGAVMTLPLLETFADERAIDRPPMRMAISGVYYGFIPEYFFPTETGETYRMPRLLRSLAPHREQLSIFSGLDHNLGGGHEATRYFLSGIPTHQARSFQEANISVDQKAAIHVGSETRYSSMVLGCESKPSNYISWTKSAAQVPPVDRLSVLYNLLFQKSNVAQKNAKRREFEERRSILDLVRDQAKSIDKEVATADKEKLDQYYTSVREMEQKIEKASRWLNSPKPETDYPTPMGLDNLTLAQRTPIFYDLMTLALQTDSTRVITLSFSELGKDNGGIPGVQSGYHSLSHHGKVRKAIDELALIESFYVDQFARFIDKLKNIREPNGQTLLDNTIAMLGSGMSNGNSHSNRNLPVILAGAGLKHGKHHQFARQGRQSVPLCNLYVTMLQRFGVETDQFNTSNGNLSELLG
ncbi:MAG: DUF1552 domain-containing protein [Verrucomicrobiota bacterium]